MTISIQLKLSNIEDLKMRDIRHVHKMYSYYLLIEIQRNRLLLIPTLSIAITEVWLLLNTQHNLSQFQQFAQLVLEIPVSSDIN